MKKIWLIIILLIPVQFMAGQDLLFRVIEDAPAWNYPHSSTKTRENARIVIGKDEIVRGRMIRSVKDTIDGREYLMSVIMYNNREYEMQSDKLVPAETNSFFDDSWITTEGEYWIQAGYLDVLGSRNRDTFYNVERDYIDSYNILKNANMYILEEWYEVTNVSTCFEINQINLLAGGFVMRAFWITNIININSGYKVTVFDLSFGQIYSRGNSYFYNPIPFPDDRRSYDLLLIRDNDYIEMYLDTPENHLATFVKVNKDVVDMLNTLLRTNTCDLSGITSLPRRADGSGYSFPTSRTIEETPPLLNTDDTAAEASQTDEPIQGGKKSQSLPLQALLAIIGGAVMLAGGVAVFVVKRRK
ncbi:MAG: hypothetical protein LBI28_09065 [Treponema sp.]|nr:hypothetical protein [Treponema sp.]